MGGKGVGWETGWGGDGEEGCQSEKDRVRRAS